MALKQPNFLFIMADQLRYDSVGAASTPNIYRVAQRGAQFTNAFTPSPLCVPARCSLASGLYPARVALDNPAFYPLSIPTYYQRLRDCDYRVGVIGKHDLAQQSGNRGRCGDRPLNYALGFTHPHETVGKRAASFSDVPVDPYTHYLKEGGLFEDFVQDYRSRAENGWIKDASQDSVLRTEDYHDTYIGTQAVEWIENIENDFPWHLFVNFVGPHDPFDPPTEYAARYRDVVVPDPIPVQEGQQPQWIEARRIDVGSDEMAHIQRQYYASIELIDHQVGLMLDVLERRGFTEDTFIVFTSDHGEMLGDFRLYEKGVPYEAAIHIPLFVCGPGLPDNTHITTFVELEDLNPTICELAGLPQQPNIDALSLCPILFGHTETHRTEIVSEYRTWRLIRNENHKLVENYNDRFELYDLQHDPQELLNIAREQPELVSDLHSRLLRHQQLGLWRR